MKDEQQVDEAALRRRTFIAFGFFFLLLIAGGFGIWWLRQQPLEQGMARPLRNVVEVNAKVAGALFGKPALAPTFDPKKAKAPRVNGSIGLKGEFDPARWHLEVQNLNHQQLSTPVTLADLKALPHTEVAHEFKCIEGWSEKTHWGGVRLLDFVKHYKLATRSGKSPDPDQSADLAKWASVETPDGKYYVGLDIASALHPQTLLCYEMNGKPLPVEHGGPVRLIVPVKYGIKSLKRIGKISFTDERPKDYWAERGYDYDSGH